MTYGLTWSCLPHRRVCRTGMYVCMYACVAVRRDTTRRELFSLLNTAFMREVLSLSLGFFENWSRLVTAGRSRISLLCLVYHTCGGCVEWWFSILIVALRCCSAFIFGLGSIVGCRFDWDRQGKGHQRGGGENSSPTGIPKSPISSVPYSWGYSIVFPTGKVSQLMLNAKKKRSRSAGDIYHHVIIDLHLFFSWIWRYYYYTFCSEDLRKIHG